MNVSVDRGDSSLLFFRNTGAGKFTNTDKAADQHSSTRELENSPPGRSGFRRFVGRSPRRLVVIPRVVRIETFPRSPGSCYPLGEARGISIVTSRQEEHHGLVPRAAHRGTTADRQRGADLSSRPAGP